MSLGYYDEQKIKRLIDEAQRETAREIRSLRDSFEGLTGAVQQLADEVRALRADLNPALDKPKKLPAPAQGT